MNAFLDYRRALRDELEKRCQKNSRYSLRAFARDVGLSAPRLSQILSGKCGLSAPAAMQVARNLSLNDEEARAFCDQVESLHGRSHARREAAQVRLGSRRALLQFQAIQSDTFKVISEWYHMAILELTYLKSFRDGPRWVARALGISEHEATAAIERLVRVGFLERSKKGRLSAVEDFQALPSGVPSETIRNYHRQIVDKAKISIDLQRVDERDLGATTFALDRAKMSEAKKALTQFRKKFCARFGADDEKNAVYCLAVQFFRLDQDQPLQPNPEDKK